MNIKNKLIAAAASLAISSCAVPFDALCAESHTVTIIDFNGKVMTTIQVPHGESVDLSKINTSELEYHINEYTQVGFNGWSTYPESITEDIAIYALFVRMSIECTAIPDKNEYYSKSGAVSTKGLTVTITKNTQTPQKDENGAFITKKEVIDISDTCQAVPNTLDEAFKKENKSQIQIIPPGGNRPIVTYNINYFGSLGDTNSDDTVDSKDASAVLELYAGTATGVIPDLSKNEYLLCDVNRDDSVDAADSSLILEYYAKSSVSENPISWDDILQ